MKYWTYTNLKTAADTLRMLEQQPLPGHFSIITEVREQLDNIIANEKVDPRGPHEWLSQALNEGGGTYRP